MKAGAEAGPPPDRPGSYRDLVVWRKGVLLARMVYRLTRDFPADERFGLISQMRRASISIPSNLAEGHARHTTGEFIQFVSHAEGSLAELDTQLVLSVQLEFASPADTTEIADLIEEMRKMLNALRRSLLARR